MIEGTTWRGVEAVRLTGHDLSVTVLPSIGGKIVSVCDAAGREYIWQRDDRAYQVPVYGTAFDDWDCSGWDECFPTIAKCTLAEGPWAGVPVPCHGEIWCVPHEVTPEGEALRLTARGVRFPYVFERRLSLPGPGRVRVEIRVQNASAFAMPYVYSAHPLLVVSEGTRVLLPGVERVRVDNTRHGRLGGLGDTLTWPIAALAGGGETDLSLLAGAHVKAGDKLYTEPLRSEGWCALADPVRGVVAGFVFDSALLPRVGIWQNQGALLGHFNLALEPCTSYPDRLDLALARGEARMLPAGGAAEWWLEFRVASGGVDRWMEWLEA